MVAFFLTEVALQYVSIAAGCANCALARSPIAVPHVD